MLSLRLVKSTKWNSCVISDKTLFYLFEFTYICSRCLIFTETYNRRRSSQLHRYASCTSQREIHSCYISAKLYHRIWQSHAVSNQSRSQKSSVHARRWILGQNEEDWSLKTENLPRVPFKGGLLHFLHFVWMFLFYPNKKVHLIILSTTVQLSTRYSSLSTKWMILDAILAARVFLNRLKTCT